MSTHSPHRRPPPVRQRQPLHRRLVPYSHAILPGLQGRNAHTYCHGHQIRCIDNRTSGAEPFLPRFTPPILTAASSLTAWCFVTISHTGGVSRFFQTTIQFCNILCVLSLQLAISRVSSFLHLSQFHPHLDSYGWPFVLVSFIHHTPTLSDPSAHFCILGVFVSPIPPPTMTVFPAVSARFARLGACDTAFSFFLLVLSRPFTSLFYLAGFYLFTLSSSSSLASRCFFPLVTF
ncbi:hypothetical protein BC835DRAFT_243367 [Cytidiella melzeri]|nr:hypothetical protein BC835DRAFT_243367 [Cytidiella melzeri]